MSEIQIQRKERSTWLWVLVGIVLLALLVWWLMARDRGEVTTSAGMIADTAAVAAGAAADAGTGDVAAFLAFTDSARTRGAMELDHTYTAAGIRHLAAALASLGTRAGIADELAPRLDSARTLADGLEREPTATRHGEYARSAFLHEAHAMSTLQQSRFPDAGGQVSAVRSAAEAMSSQRDLLQQKAQVQQFFDRAAAALRSMGGTAS